MGKVLGLDLGTSSLGWAIVDKDAEGITLLDKGVDIFQEGVAREKGNEKPAVQARTQARASRRHYFRRRLRKIQLLKVLVKEEFCPPIPEEQLAEWRHKKRYPLLEEFIVWQRTDDNIDKNPYHDRYRALTEKLDLDKKEDRYVLGRAFYHLAQRRGFLSNRKDAADEKETGKVKSQIKGLTQEMQNAGCRYLGEYFYQLYQRKEKIRQTYTSRVEHYEAEFNAICKRQNLSENLRKALYDAIFYQRPLKSQKGLVGKCTFERNKSRCPVSHPCFEEFRMLSFINNIRVTVMGEADKRPLTAEEVDKIRPLFFRKSKSYFDFEDIAKKIAGKSTYACKGDTQEAEYRFNYSKGTTVSGCPVTAGLKAVFGEDYCSEICSLYLLADGKTENQILNDVWHALFSFDNDDKLANWAKKNLQLSDADAQKFAGIPVPRDYAALSLNAINKILPFLRRGMRYDEAVFVANLKKVLPEQVYADTQKREKIEVDIETSIAEFWSNPLNKETTKEKVIRDYLQDNFPEIDGRHLDNLYHPSMIETYPAAQPNADGIFKLGSPRTSAIRNPMAMRALFRLRILVNHLLREKKIDKDTKIRIEFARGLNDANRRKAIEQYQREREVDNQRYIKELKELYHQETQKSIDPTDEDVLKYRLWEEQKHRCLYTGKQINISDFIGASSSFDIEHTIPRSMGGDDSLMNKTLCENHFNRDIKKGKLPSQLSNRAEILQRIETLGWQSKKDGLKKQKEACKRKRKIASTKDQKDKAIQEFHYLKLKYDYWDGKLKRFHMDEVPDGFSNRQGVDIGIIGKYAKMYLKTVFNHIEIVKGATTADFRKMWGLQEEYIKKERNNHVHHCIDAITIACIGRNEYDNWARYMADEERYDRGESGKPVFPKPWLTFTEDVKAISEEILIAHHTPDYMAKQSRKKWRVRGKIKRDENNNPIYIQGDTARSVLHQDTFYGAIERDGEVKYVVRKSLDQLKEGDVKNIVDDVVRQKVEDAIKAYGKDALDPDKCPVWMNEEKRIPIRKVRLFTPSITNPIHLKPQRDQSIKNYKQHYHVANEGNYCIAIYEGTDNKGKPKRSFEIVNNIKAAKYFKAGTDKASQTDLVPQSDKDGNPLKYILKTGTMVLFYEDNPSELYQCTQKELVKRLYKVVGMSSLVIQKKYTYGTLSFKYHQEARPAGELKAKNGQWKMGEDYRPLIGIYHTQLQAYVEGYDFDLAVDGKINFKH